MLKVWPKARAGGADVSGAAVAVVGRGEDAEHGGKGGAGVGVELAGVAAGGSKEDAAITADEASRHLRRMLACTSTAHECYCINYGSNVCRDLLASLKPL